MSGKKVVIRSENKLADLDPKIQALYDSKMVAITKAEEAEEEQAEKTNDELIKTMIEGIIELYEIVGKLKQGGSIQKVEQPKDNENLERLTKSLSQSSGIPLKMVKKGRRRVKI